MRYILLFLAIMLGAAPVFAQQPTTLLLEDFEAEPTWDGVSLDSEDARSGESSGIWVPDEINRIRTESIPDDWSGYDRLTFWLHSAVANGQSLTVVADSMNPDSDGWDYYYHHFTVDWEGWRLISLELGEDIRGTREPVGWHKINYLMLSASGWNNTPRDDTVLRVDEVRLVRDPAAISHLGYDEERVDGEFRVTHRYEVTNRTDRSTSFPLSIDGEFDLFDLAPGGDRTPEMAPGEQAEISVALSAPLSEVDAARPLSREAGRLLVGAEEHGIPPVMAPIAAAVPLPEIERPFLFTTREEIDRAKQRAQTYDWARTRLDSIMASGDAALALEVEVPDEGGQWSHHYVCEDCGVGLKTQSPTEHVCSRCEKVHTGWPYDQVVIGRQHHRLTQAVRDLGLAYAFTDDVRYAEKAREILLAYGEKYRSFPLHNSRGQESRSAGRLYAQTLDEAVDIIKVAWGYDLIYDSGVFSDEDRSIIEDGYLRAVAEVVRRNDAGISNWQSWHNAGLAAIGFCLRDSDLASLAIDGRHGLRFQLENSILPDGFWYEGTAAYHFYALSALRWTVEAAFHSGIDFYDNAAYKSLYDAPLLYVFPDLTFPAVNDSDVFPLTSRHPLYEIAYSRFGDENYLAVASPGHRQSLEAFLWGVDELPSAAPLRLPGKTFEGLGATILRAGEGEDQTYAHLDWGPHGGGHGHPDKLALILYAMGAELAPDPGRLAYGASLQGAWYKQTVSHNTVVLDERSQRATEGALLLFHDGEIARIARAECDSAYDDVMLRRTLLLADDYLLDVYDYRADEEHTADYVYHNVGEHAPLLETTPLEGPLGEGSGYQHITGVSTAEVDDTWQTGFTVPDVGQVRLTMLGEPGTELFLGTGITGRGTTPCPALVARRQTSDTSWVSSIEWRAGEAQFAITGIERVPVEADGEAVAFRIDRTDGHDLLILAPGVDGEKRADGMTTSGQLAFFTVRDGEVTGMERVDVMR
ncbi:MAG: heparinase II/III domain-containing protein [Armatimonadota bacterium]